MDASSGALLGVLGGAVVLALGLAVYTLLVHIRYPDLAPLKSRLTGLENDVADLRDSLEHAVRRSAARARRENATARAEGTTIGGAAADPMPTDPRERKMMLRRRFSALPGVKTQ